MSEAINIKVNFSDEQFIILQHPIWRKPRIYENIHIAVCFYEITKSYDKRFNLRVYLAKCRGFL